MYGIVTDDGGKTEEGVVSILRYSSLTKLSSSRQLQSLLRGQGFFAIVVSLLGKSVGQVVRGVLCAVTKGTNFNGVILGHTCYPDQHKSGHLEVPSLGT